MNQLISNQALTMTSVDLLDQINAFRAMDGQGKVRNNDFILRVEDEITDLPAYESFVSNKQRVRGYQLNKDQCLLIGMRESKAVRKNVLNWLKNLTEKPVKPSWLDNLSPQAVMALEDLSSQLELAAPKVAFVDKYVAATSGNKTFREVCKLMSVKENAFRDFLRDEKIMYHLNKTWSAYSNHIDAGRFTTNTGEANGHVFNTTYFTPKGVEWIAGQYAKFKLNQELNND